MGTMGDPGGFTTTGERVNPAHVMFDRFTQASTCKGTLKAFQELCDHLDLKPCEYRIFYHKLKSRLNYWKAKALWVKLDKRAGQKEYKKGRACVNSKCLIIGAGPCGLRTAIELGFLGAKVVLLEKRDAFSRNNVLHLWPFSIQDLRGLGAKKFHGKFCAGAIDHISIRQLQLMLLKVALLLGIEIHVNVEFKGLIEPPEDQENERIGWRAEVHPRTHPVNELEFDVIIGADGRRNTLAGFRRKEFRGKLAIAITANFINRNTTAEAKVEEISGVAFIFNQKFFQDLREATGIDLENIVYYKDDTHYFVMTAKKQSLLEKGVILHPFWPMGTGIARGFLAAMDSGWMVKSWAQGNTPLDVLAERESIYRLLPQTTPENISKNFSHYSVDPTTRYPNISLHFLRPNQVQHLIDTGDSSREMRIEMENVVTSSTPKLTRNESIARSSKLLNWCQRQTEGYRKVSVTDLTMSWKSGMALCSLIHRYRPDLIDFDSLDERDQQKNNQLGFDVAEREFGISPCMTGKEMSQVSEPDKLSMVMYLSQFYEMFKDTVPPGAGDNQNMSPEEKAALINSTKSPISFLSKLGQSIAISRKRNPKDKKEKDVDGLGKRRKTSQAGHSEEEEVLRGNHDDRPSNSTALTERKMKEETAAVGNHNKVKSMATQLLAKFEENAPAESKGLKRQGSLRKEFPQNIGGSDVCFFCRKRVYVMERLSAEGKFFHRSCFKCDYCGTTLRLSSYAFDVEDGKFYCKPHYCYRLSGQAQRKRPAPTSALLNTKDNQASLPVMVTVDSPGRGEMASLSPAERQTSVPEVNGLQEPSLPKRLRGTPERIELENYRLSLQREEDLEEVPEETLAEHNLSSVLDKDKHAELGSSSSESDMEEEDQEDEDHEEEEQQEPPSPSDLGGVPWKEAVEIHAKLKTDSDPGAEGEDGAQIVRDLKVEEEEDDEEEDDEEESSDAPANTSTRHEAVRVWLESVSGETCEDEDPEVEVGSHDFEPGTEMDQEDIPSDAEAEALLHQSEISEAFPEEDKKSESQGLAFSIEQSSVSPVKLVGEVVLLPVKPPTPQPDSQMSHPSPCLVKSPGMHFFPEPFPLEDFTTPQRTSQTPNAKSPPYPAPTMSPIRSPVCSPVHSPICSQPVPLLETVTTKSPVNSPSCSCPPTGNPLSPICAQPLPCQEPSSSLTSDSPVRTQPVPAVTSTPLVKPASSDRAIPEPQKSLDSSDLETPVKKTDIIEEFWLKSAEIRKSLGLTPMERSSSKSPEKSPVTVGRVPTPDSSSPKSYTPEDLSEQLSPFTGRSVIRRLNITVEGQVISPVEPKSKATDQRDLSSSSGLGLNGSTTTSQTSQAASDSYNTSDSTMLTPPSSPPPPPPNEEPATLRQQEKHHVSWNNGIDGPTTPEPAKAAPTKIKSPVPVPRTQLSPVSVPKPAPRATLVTSPITAPVNAPVVTMRREKSIKPRREEVRKSFVECVAEIPFADDVEDTYDERTPDTTMDRFYTPPTSRPNREREKPPLHLALAMENGTANFPGNQQASKNHKAQQFSPEAKEIAEERMRAREKSIKSQALKDAMAKQLSKMKETDMAKGSATTAKVVWNVASSETSGKSTKKLSGSPKTSAVIALESKKAETLPELFFSIQVNKSLDGSTVSSDGSASGGKSKKRSSLFSPRKNKKEKKAKNESRLSYKHGADETPSPPKHKSLWKAVFSGYKKDKKKNKDDKSCPSTPSSSTTNDSGKKRSSPLGRSSDLKSRRNRSFSEDSDLSCDDVLERSSLKSKADSVYVPHALAFKRAYATKKTYTEEELNAKLTRRVQKAARRQAKQEELKRLHRAQIIQRQLEQVEEKQRQLEERGVAVEKALRGEAGMGKKDDPKLMQEWFKLVQEKNALVRYESELMIFARELELEDRQSRLQQDLRERMAIEDHMKTEVELAQEKHILNEMLEVVEQRDSLVALLEEQRLSEKEEDKDLESVMLSKGFNLNWA
uniref:F-actin monooxygenase n=1 Tax=Oncorhynchus kisutch TaxID=8019 RepID=A0A8C7G1J4_ONCKI